MVEEASGSDSRPAPPQMPPPPPREALQQGRDPVSLVIPYKNPYALTAYYLAVFSLIPGIGGILGVAACALGITGLVYARRHPGARGHVHAWVGIVLGGLIALAHVALVLMALRSAIQYR